VICIRFNANLNKKQQQEENKPLTVDVQIVTEMNNFAPAKFYKRPVNYLSELP